MSSGMDADRWSQIERLFDEVLPLPDAERERCFAAAAVDADVIAEVRSLLAHHMADEPTHEEALGRVAARWAADESSAANASLIGRRIGSYEVIDVVGQGGMGAVYRARRADGQFDQDVAIKLIRLGFETPLALDRFRQERQILARLSHPAIARLLDGGTTASEGGETPYLVMEYIAGEPITAYCARHEMTTTDRLRLILRVCEGVQYAHQQLIVHRDLKPSNILVDTTGAPKLLDFGIAKLITEDETLQTSLTSTGLQMFTPDYASPEQVTGMPATAATDIYSLGAVLYELLSGAKAHRFERQSPLEIGRVICEAEATRPSAAVAPTMRGAMRLRRQLEGDLDTIVLKTLRKEPARRYASVEQLSEDLRRHLEGLPVLARADAFGYRAAKFVRRNRVALVAGVLVTASLVGGTVVSVWQARRAERRFEQVRRLANSLIYDVHDEIRDLTGSTRARQKIVATGLEYLGALEQEAAGDPGLERDMAAAYMRIGEVQGGVLASNLGDVKGALESFRRARRLLERHLSAADGPRQVAAIDVKIGDALSYHGDLKGAVAAYATARSVIEPLATKPGARPADLAQLAAIFQATSRAQGLLRDMTASIDSSMRVLAIRRQLVDADTSNTTWREALASAQAEVSMSLQRTSRVQEALPHAREALTFREAQAAAQPNNVAAQRALILAYSHVADVLGNPTMPSLGDTAGAIALYRKMTAVAERLAAADASDRRAKLDLANCRLRLGSALVASPDADEGITQLEQSIALMRALADAEPKNNRVRVTLAFVHGRLGDALSAKQRREPALENYQHAIRVAEQVLAADPAEATMTSTLGIVYGSQGLVLAQGDKRDAALKSGARGLEVLENARRTQPGNPRTLSSVAGGYAAMGRIHRALGAAADTAPACSWFEKSAAAYAESKRIGQLDVASSADLERVARELEACPGRAATRN